jgi:hypothetical protein
LNAVGWGSDKFALIASGDALTDRLLADRLEPLATD